MKPIIITSIFNPTEAVKMFAQMEGHRLIVVADKKTPTDWACDGVDFLSVQDQENMGFSMARVLPYNHYCRKMLGYLHAIKSSADIIIDTDDDNLPKPGWNFPAFKGKFHKLQGDLGFVNIYQMFTDAKIWPRGLPLRLITKDFELEKKVSTGETKIGVWQGLADEDPDVDAIYRLTSDTPCNFNDREPVVLAKGTLCPFNTQNTAVVKELFPLLYLPTFVTFRFTDILRGLVAQPIMWLYGYELGFTKATVIQKRNPHDYMKDFISEIPMYQHTESVIEAVSAAVTSSKSINDNLHAAYEALLQRNIVEKREMEVLEAWLKDIAP